MHVLAGGTQANVGLEVRVFSFQAKRISTGKMPQANISTRVHMASYEPQSLGLLAEG